MKLTAKVYKTPSCAAFVIVEDAHASFASTSVQFTGTHSDYLADVFAHNINTNGVDTADTSIKSAKSFFKKLFK